MGAGRDDFEPFQALAATQVSDSLTELEPLQRSETKAGLRNLDQPQEIDWLDMLTTRLLLSAFARRVLTLL